MTRVVVLYGGISAEREVSLATGRQVIAALREAGYDVAPVDVGPDLRTTLAALDPRPDAVFNALHGRFGEDGAIQGVLDWLEIPYTHSGVRASAMAMDKSAAKAIFAAAGLPVATGRVIDIAELEHADPMPLPYVVKPNTEGSSVGVEIMRHGDNRRAEIRRWRLGACHSRPRASANDGARAGHRARRASRAWLPWRDAVGFPLRRHTRRAGPAGAAGSQHATGADADLAAARTGRASRHVVPATLRLDGGERGMPRVTRKMLPPPLPDRPGKWRMIWRRQRRMLRPAVLLGTVMTLGHRRSRIDGQGHRFRHACPHDGRATRRRPWGEDRRPDARLLGGRRARAP
jgi:hypothetical protein